MENGGLKRRLSILLMSVVVSATLIGCGTFTCDFCGDEKKGKNYKSEVWGEELIICKDCYNELQDLFGGY